MVNVGDVYISPYNGERVVVTKVYPDASVEFAYLNFSYKWKYTCSLESFDKYTLCPKFMLKRKLTDEKKIS